MQFLSLRHIGRIRSFHDLPLWIKTLLAPSAGMVAGLMLIVSLWLGAREIETRLAGVTDEALPMAAASATVLDQVDTIHVMAMRALVWQQAGVPKATIDGLSHDVGQGLEALRAITAGMVAGRAEGDADLPQLKEIAAQSSVYGKQLSDALDLIGDPAIAVGYFRRADATFDTLRAVISDLSTARRSAETMSIQDARDRSHASLIRSYWIFCVFLHRHAGAAAGCRGGDLPPRPRADADHGKTRGRRDGRRGHLPAPWR